MLTWFYAALGGQNRLKFYWIDPIDSACRQLEDPAFAGKLSTKLYHQFEQQGDRFGNREFEKANSGLVFESFQMRDMELECALAPNIIASDAAHHGNVVFRPMYCKILFDDLSYWLINFSACLFNLKESKQFKGLNWLHLCGFRITMICWHDRPIKGLGNLKYCDSNAHGSCESESEPVTIEIGHSQRASKYEVGWLALSTTCTKNGGRTPDSAHVPVLAKFIPTVDSSHSLSVLTLATQSFMHNSGRTTKKRWSCRWQKRICL